MAVSKKTATVIASGVLALGAGIGVANMAAADTTPTATPTSGTRHQGLIEAGPVTRAVA